MARTKVIVFLLVIVGFMTLVATLTYLNRATVSDSSTVTRVVNTHLPVRTLVLTPLTLEEKLVSTGLLQAKQDIMVTSEVAGKVLKVHKSLGDPCKKDELVARLDPEGYKIALSQAQAAFSLSEVGLSQAQRDKARMEKLKQGAVVTAQQLDGAQTAVSSGEANREQARATLELAQRNVRETSIRCPFSGYMAERMIDRGQTVMPQTPLFRLVDTSELKLAISVTSKELSRLRVGQLVVLQDPSWPDKTHMGKVSRIGVAADLRTKNFPVEVSVDSPEEGLRAGQVVQAALQLQQHENVLSVPVEAVFGPATGRHVFAVQKQKAIKTPIRVGAQIDDKYVVLGGLKTGDEVVVVGGDNLRHGQDVDVVEKSGALEPGSQKKDAGAGTPNKSKAE